jgi:hypothetical protein
MTRTCEERGDHKCLALVNMNFTPLYLKKHIPSHLRFLDFSWIWWSGVKINGRRSAIAYSNIGKSVTRARQLPWRDRVTPHWFAFTPTPVSRRFAQYPMNDTCMLLSLSFIPERSVLYSFLLPSMASKVKEDNIDSLRRRWQFFMFHKPKW